MCRPVDTEDTKLTQIICLNRCNFHVLCAANAKKKRKEEKKDDTDAVTRRRTSEQREGGGHGRLYTQERRIFHGIRTDIIHGGGSSFPVAWHLGSLELEGVSAETELRKVS